MRRSISSLVLPACKHTRTRSLPFGTVGHVIGRAFMPRARRKAESGRGWGVRMGMIGDGRPKVDGARMCDGRETSAGGISRDSRRGCSVSVK
jgi:hypothetical protein